ncbi:uncharacterized protein LOC121738816 [Aricia agestis]|uniref:uncharacterized protein LOC121734341 n=1 Tax=Aricia agestis TaxID=91739 RepID=UPI001C20894E|nr:uncharacterized protein LOC121734341 [Aricia agestis]XP_041987001.1 uncharacterized protein LOC121738816 [Aricia agestis]
MSVDRNTQCASSVASDEGQACNSSGADAGSSSSEDEAGFASPPPNKRRRRYVQNPYADPRVDVLMDQVSRISNFVSELTSQTMHNTNTHQIINNCLPGPSHAVQSSNLESTFLKRPCTSSNNLTLGELNIDYDDKKIIPSADKDRLLELVKYQKFNTQAWKGIRYKKAMQSYAATPGFIGLKINEELCHFSKNKDYLASTEQLLASLSNVLLEQRQLLQTGLRGIVDWASADAKNLNANSLCERFLTTFGPGSSISKNSELSMQIICGKRAECIEVRRDRILKEIANSNLRATLQNVPPSSEYLFSREGLQPIIQSLGGSQTWLNTPSYLKEKRSSTSFNQHSNKKQRFPSTRSYKEERKIKTKCYS